MDLVYFIRDPQRPAMKVGVTGDLKFRLACLSGRRRDLELVASVPGGRALEGQFHSFLIEHHIGHEWFRCDPKVEAVALALKEGWFDFSKLPPGPSAIRSAIAAEAHARRRDRLLREAA